MRRVKSVSSGFQRPTEGADAQPDLRGDRRPSGRTGRSPQRSCAMPTSLPQPSARLSASPRRKSTTLLVGTGDTGNGPVLAFEVLDRNRAGLSSVRVIEVAGEDAGRPRGGAREEFGDRGRSGAARTKRSVAVRGPGADGTRRHMADVSARRGSIHLGNVRLPCRTGGVHETMGVDAHFGAPVMHTGRPAHPAARQRLAASPRGRPWRRSRLGRGGERPQGHRGPVRARGRARFHTLVPAPFWGRSLTSNPLREGQIGGPERVRSGCRPWAVAQPPARPSRSLPRPLATRSRRPGSSGAGRRTRR